MSHWATDDGEPLTMEQLGEGLPGSLVIGGTYLYRQYVWGPGHTDELLAEYDEDNTPWFTLQDAATDVVALCDASGGVATQYLYDPYGEPLKVEHLVDNPPLNKAGHHGLFFDRLDQGAIQTVMVNTEVLDPGARGVYQNRNRIYDPRLGRFLQRDPNHSGTACIRLDYWGSTPRTGVWEFAESEMYVDGLSLYGYLSHRPTTQHDPLGLFDMGLAGQMMMMAVNSWMDADGTLEDARRGVVVGFNFADMLRQYVDDLSDDVDWAMDWSQGDEDYTRTGFGPRGASRAWMIENYGPAVAGAGGVIWKKNGGRNPYVGRLTGPARSKLRNQASYAFRASGGHRGPTSLQHKVHHRIPLEYSHLFDGHPNRNTNLVSVSQSSHKGMERMWTEFRLNNPHPTGTQVMAQVFEVDRVYGHSMRSLR